MDERADDAPRRRLRRWSLRDAGLLVALAAAYFLAARFGLSLAFVHSSVSAVWPATGIAIAALVVLGLRYWPAVLVGALLANYGSTGHLASSLPIAAGNSLEALVGAYAVRKWAGGVHAFERPRGVFTFIGLAGLLAPAVAATVGVASLVAFGLAPAAAARSIWLTWWLGDAAGAIVLAPALILLATPRPADGVRPHPVEAAAAMTATLCAGIIVFSPLGAALFTERPFAFLTVPFVVWAALRLGPRLTAVTALVLDIAATWGTLSGHGPFVLADTNDSLVYLQTFLGVVTLVALPTAALAHQQAVAQAGLRRAAEGLEALVAARTESLQSSQAALRKSLRSVAEAERATGRGSWEWDVTTDRAVWSEGMYRLFGVDPATFVNSNENFLAMVEPEDRERMGRAIADALAKPGRFHQEYRLRRPDGALRSIQGEGNVVVDDDGKARTLFGVVQDVTELREAEQARKRLQQMVAESEARLSTIFQNSPVGIIITRRDGTVVDLNPAAEALWRRPRADFLHPDFRMHHLYADPAQRKSVTDAILRDGRARDLEVRMLRGDGKERTLRFNVEVIQVGGEQVFLASGIDITPLREGEERLKESEARLRAVLDNASDAIITGDAAGRIIGWNRAAERIFGYTQAEALGKSIAALMPPEQWAIYEQDVADVLQSKSSASAGRPREGQALRKGGAPIDVELSLGAWQGPAGPMVIGVARDITERKKAQAESQRAQERFARVFQASPVPICLTKESGTFVDVNDAFCDLVGRPREALLAGDVKATDIWEDPQERKRMLIAIRERGIVRDLELRVKRPDGEVRTTLASIEFIDLGGDTTILSLLQDITDRLRAQEEREARRASEEELERLRRADRFRTDFINNIAHELATPLTPLVLKTKTLAADKTLTPAQRTHVEAMERGVARLRHLVDDMVGAADLQARSLALDKRRLNLTRELRAAVAAHHPAAERAGLTMDEPEDTGLTVSADPARLQLVLGHLLGNAIKFTPKGGRITVASRRTGVDDVRIEVRDTGVGLTRKQMEGLWRPFQQAHDKSQRTDSGSGLGLYVTKGIVDLHGGEVGVNSAGPGQGSTFWFTLPLATGHLDPLARPKEEPAAAPEPKRNLNPGV